MLHIISLMCVNVKSIIIFTRFKAKFHPIHSPNEYEYMHEPTLIMKRGKKAKVGNMKATAKTATTRL